MNSWDWAGTFVCHEIYQRPDGTLGVKLPDSMLSAFEPAAEVLKGDAVLKTVEFSGKPSYYRNTGRFL